MNGPTNLLADTPNLPIQPIPRFTTVLYKDYQVNIRKFRSSAGKNEITTFRYFTSATYNTMVQYLYF